MDPNKQDALLKYQKVIAEHAQVMETMRDINESMKNQTVEFEKTEKDINALQSIGQMVGEVLKQLDEERFIVKTSQGPRYIVGARKSIPRELLVLGARVALDITTLTIMRHLPREVDPTVHAMSIEKPGDISFDSIGGLAEQVREIREVIELPIKNPEIFSRVGVSAPKGVLLYGPPGTGKTLLARAVAATLDSNFLKVVSSAIIEKYIGESSRMIREMFTYAKENQPCVIFLDEIDAIGGKRSSESTSSDREVQRTLMELLNQMDGFEELGRVKVIMATNRPDILDPALLRPGRLDRKIEIPLPTSQGRLEILKIHSQKMEKKGDIDYNTIVKMSHGFNGADIRNICSEAGMLAIRDDRDFIVQEDLTRSVRKIAEQKKLEGRMDYKKV
ncbi:26S proteasome regulatory subunit T4 [Nematocida parisii]|uniref:ATPase n=1 Tax=Nematocida parisii (strain ERTm3) TaxID=935791 RepID=I3EDF6_NEMP3|nr:ATPase [Nematocida parisii ERTm1]EIJ87253.1 ATPase [Nematocida parisii ERTm3]KAI5126634.1 26S proteasome regulatory subunit T4 [Nematocida parisii]EIJ95048.1 ATPase [Nematocida parisii ERTm1]KAI5127917.1 26S proteasome regulatory subunit T4 [Nematocida parisii]KAI5142855.1 26S proteasome regulatory subunit T4 [Nematocida parisii]|eukprot:XP_013058404.1 ATPase [Nematocida parisii ERTm1]